MAELEDHMFRSEKNVKLVVEWTNLKMNVIEWWFKSFDNLKANDRKKKETTPVIYGLAIFRVQTWRSWG